VPSGKANGEDQAIFPNREAKESLSGLGRGWFYLRGLQEF
jgi:hypothetical protein